MTELNCEYFLGNKLISISTNVLINQIALNSDQVKSVTYDTCDAKDGKFQLGQDQFDKQTKLKDIRLMFYTFCDTFQNFCAVFGQLQIAICARGLTPTPSRPSFI